MYLHLHFYCCYICVLMCNVSTESLTNLNLLRAYKHVFFVFVNGYDNVKLLLYKQQLGLTTFLIKCVNSNNTFN